MELALFIWAAGVIGSMSTFFGVSGIILLCLLLFRTIDTAIDNDTYRKKDLYPFQKSWGKWTVAIATISLLVANLLPSEKTMYLILAGYTGQKVIQSEAADKVVQIINNKLDEYLVEAEKELKK